MSEGWKSYKNAAKFRDLVASIAQKVVEQMRPAATYATVVSVDRTNRKVTVTYPDGGEVQLSCSSNLPVGAGQVVRIEGTSTDRFVSAVLGSSETAGGGVPIGAVQTFASGIDPGPNWVLANGATVNTSNYPILAARRGITASTMVLPNVSGAYVRVS